MPTMKSWKDHSWHGVPVMKKRIESILELAEPKDKLILEVGCNEGFVSRALQEAGAKKVVSVDKDPEMMLKAKRMFGLDVIVGDVQALKFDNKEFDVVVAGELLEHVENPFKGLTELFRVCRETLIITLPVGRYWLGEVTHQWELAGDFIEHDSVSVYKASKDILVLCWRRRRDSEFRDIPPFNTAELKKEFGIK